MADVVAFRRRPRALGYCAGCKVWWAWRKANGVARVRCPACAAPLEKTPGPRLPEFVRPGVVAEW